MTTESNDSTKDADEELPELSPEEVSNLLAEEDPEFAAQLSSLKNEKLDITGDPESIDIDKHAPIIRKPLRERIQDQLHIMKYWPFFKKLTLFLVIVGVPGMGFYFYYIFHKDFIHPRTQLFVNSFEEWSEQSYTWNYDNPNEKDVFYNSTQLPLYVYNLKKLIVNLRPEGSFGAHPMIALELVAEGTSPEVVTELKEREDFFRDLFQQELSQMSFENLAEPDGKMRMIEQLRRTANEKLERGKLRKLFIKNIILKK